MTFEHEESCRRCKDDYRNSSSGLVRFFQPYRLRYSRVNSEGKKESFTLHVGHATSPNEVVWENLEFSTNIKRSLRVGSTLFTALLLAVSICGIVTVYNTKFLLSKDVPSSYDCMVTIPSIFSGSFENIPNEVNLVHIESKDSICPSGEFFITFADPGLALLAETLPDLSVPGQATSTMTRENFADISPYPLCDDNCSPPKSSSLCATLSCGISSYLTPCKPYSRSLPSFCYCMQVLKSKSQEGPYAFANWISESTEGNFCSPIMRNLALTQTLGFAATGVVVFINSSFMQIIPRMITAERHGSTSGKETSTFRKVGLAQIVNTALVTVIVNAKVIPIFTLSLLPNCIIR